MNLPNSKKAFLALNVALSVFAVAMIGSMLSTHSHATALAFQDPLVYDKPNPCSCEWDAAGQSYNSNGGANGQGSLPASLMNTFVGLLFGGSGGDPVDLTLGLENYSPAADLTVYNPVGPNVSWKRTWNQFRYASGTPGLPGGWTLNYDFKIVGPVGSASSIGGPDGDPTPATYSSISLQYPNGGSELLGTSPAPGPNYPALNVGKNAPYTIAYSSSSSDTIVLTWRNSLQTWTFTEPAPTSGGSFNYVLTKISDRFGHYVSLRYSTGSNPTLQSIVDSNNTALLNVVYGNYGGTSYVSQIYDRYGRYVDYTIAAIDTGIYSLTGVSQIHASGAAVNAKESYGYLKWVESNPIYYRYLLQTITKPPLAALSGSHVGVVNSTKGTIAYDSSSRVSSLTDSNHNVTSFSYGSGATTVTRKDATGATVGSYVAYYDSLKRNTGYSDSAGNRSTISYASANAYTYSSSSVAYADGTSESYTYDTYGNVTSHTDTLGITTNYTWGFEDTVPGGYVTQVTVPNLLTASFTYMGVVVGHPPYNLQSIQVTDLTGLYPGLNGTVASFQYDGYGNTTSVQEWGTDSSSTITATASYAGIGEPTTITDALGHSVSLTYGTTGGAAGQVVSATDAAGHTSTYTYDLSGNVVSATRPATGTSGSGASSVSYTYAYVGGPLISETSYDESGAVMQTINAQLGSEGELLTVTGNTTDPVSYAYDGAYRVKSVTDGNGNATTYLYNISGELLKVTNPGGDTVQYAGYDAMGRVGSRTDGNGLVTTYAYNGPGKALSAVSYSSQGANNIGLSYDSFGRLTSRTDGSGSESYVYDSLSRLVSFTTSYTGLAAKAFSFAYNPNGSVHQMLGAAGTWTYAYDAAGKWQSLASPAGTSSVSYLNNDWLASRTLPNGVSTSYSYNAVGMLTGLTNSNSSGTLSSFTNFNYDGVFNLKGFSANVPGSSNNGTSSYTYDANFRLTGETTPSATNSFAYDAAGNPTTFKGLTQTFNANNQLTSNTYDLNGNPTTYKGTSLTFDPENRMTGYGSAFAAGYRCDNLRAWKQNASGQRTYFYYVGGTPVLETDASGNVTATNVFDGAGLVARQSGGAWVYYAFDQQGNVTQRLDGSGNVLGTLAFDAYGAGSTADPFGYNGQWGYYSDAETGLYYCQNRYYDASAGRWLTRDPSDFEGGMNVYAYVSQSPTGFIDEDGLRSRVIVIIGKGHTYDGEPEISPDDVAFAQHLLAKYSDKWLKIPYYGPSRGVALRAIAKADVVIIISHGASGWVGLYNDGKGGRDGFTPSDVLSVLGGRKLSRLDVYACQTENPKRSNDDWRPASSHGSAYSVGHLCHIRFADSGDEAPDFRW